MTLARHSKLHRAYWHFGSLIGFLDELVVATVCVVSIASAEWVGDDDLDDGFDEDDE